MNQALRPNGQFTYVYFTESVVFSRTIPTLRKKTTIYVMVTLSVHYTESCLLCYVEAATL